MQIIFFCSFSFVGLPYLIGGNLLKAFFTEVHSALNLVWFPNSYTVDSTRTSVREPDYALMDSFVYI